MKSPREYVIFRGKDILVKVKNPIGGLDTKTFKAKLINYQENVGLVVVPKETEKEICISLDNIFSVRLDEDININNQNKGEDND